MIDDPIRLHRRSIRLPEHDYAQAGANFVTVVARQRECLLSEIISGQVQLRPTGQFVQREWQRLPGRFPGIELDEFVIMPNHIHGIIIINTPRRGAADLAPGHDGDAIPLRPATPDPDPDSRRGAAEPGRDHDGDATPLRPATSDPDHDTCRGAAEPGQDHGLDIIPLRPYTAPRTNVVPGSLGAIVRAFKSSTTYRCHRTRFSSGSPLWQRNYYEHIIRNDADLARNRRYIHANPAQWENDGENPFKQPP